MLICDPYQWKHLQLKLIFIFYYLHIDLQNKLYKYPNTEKQEQKEK